MQFLHNWVAECLTSTTPGRAWGPRVIHVGLGFIWAVIKLRPWLADMIVARDAAWSREATALVEIHIRYMLFSCF